jgi:hypothetical protein
VTVGGIDRTSTETGEFSQTSTESIAHENYDDNLIINDVAVIKLPTAFTLS